MQRHGKWNSPNNTQWPVETTSFLGTIGRLGLPNLSMYHKALRIELGAGAGLGLQNNRTQWRLCHRRDIMRRAVSGLGRYTSVGVRYGNLSPEASLKGGGVVDVRRSVWRVSKESVTCVTVTESSAFFHVIETREANVKQATRESSMGDQEYG
ncbi:hypothetical protein DFH09DRAFT_1399485 [Mycena vulgaris]|nr:hypothetical protein DFH09DRAFT_1399485 [Mycena vulgaris]